MLIHPNIPVAESKIRVVTNPAPALSPGVAGVMAAGSATLWAPAFGFPTLGPPVWFVTGGAISLRDSILAKITLIERIVDLQDEGFELLLSGVKVPD